eukprot:TRINITY_DN25014_c0_g1_i3.p1 TRINITY_DN25014_c0_g1~~TRINITY_DN25014_c0_g1_i3.p1  ORF type:complete len:322 (-),score=78.89 TRINITY_DN25014_c0_g1_i3:405-1370(-)
MCIRDRSNSEGFRTPRGNPPPSPSLEPSDPLEAGEWLPLPPTKVVALGAAAVIRFPRRSQRRGILQPLSPPAPPDSKVQFKAINCWGGVYPASLSRQTRSRRISRAERMESERRILKDMAGTGASSPVPPASTNVSLAFSQAAATRNIDQLAAALAGGSAPNHDGMVQVKLSGGLFPKWAQLFVSVAGGVLVCKEAPWASDALAPASLLKATEVTLAQRHYIKVEGLWNPPLELWHESEQEAVTWFITLWCSRIMARVAARLGALDHSQQLEFWSQELLQIGHVLLRDGQAIEDGKGIAARAANATLSKARDIRDRVLGFF